MHVLVAGGSGYIGSHMVKRLGETGINVTTLDNLSSGRRDAVTHGAFVKGDLGNRELLNDYDGTYGLKSVCLRYFSAAGAVSLVR